MSILFARDVASTRPVVGVRMSGPDAAWHSRPRLAHYHDCKLETVPPLDFPEGLHVCKVLRFVACANFPVILCLDIALTDGGDFRHAASIQRRGLHRGDGTDTMWVESRSRISMTRSNPDSQRRRVPRTKRSEHAVESVSCCCPMLASQWEKAYPAVCGHFTVHAA